MNRNIVIRTEGLAAGFGEHLLYHDLALEIRAGDFALIRGENGSGKTTLLKTFLGLIRPRAGRVFFMGYEVGSRAWQGVRSLLAYVPQHVVTGDFPVSALEVAEMGTVALRLHRRDKKSAARDAMRRTHCLHLEHRPYDVLSGGEKQRVSIARCLAQRADVLLLDEPAAHLDRRSRADFMDLLRTLNREDGITVVLVSHEHHDDDAGAGAFITLTDGSAVFGRAAPA